MKEHFLLVLEYTEIIQVVGCILLRGVGLGDNSITIIIAI